MWPTASRLRAAPDNVFTGGAVRARRRQRNGIDGQTCRLHAWACPVIMKTDPDHVAWTCACCGALAVTAVGERPQGSERHGALARSVAPEAA
jgi:hypothetical protein